MFSNKTTGNNKIYLVNSNFILFRLKHKFLNSYKKDIYYQGVKYHLNKYLLIFISYDKRYKISCLN